MVNGAVFIDKPSGITSMQALQRVKRLFRVKAGHTGTLDPVASGLLIILLGQSTRFSELLMRLDKVYLVDAILGKRTDTFDSEGNIIEMREVNLTCQQVQALLENFTGERLQKPPPFSAKRVDGERAYKLARAGLKFELKESKIFIKKAQLINCTLPLVKILFEVSSGTYIRSLVDELGQILGCGAYVAGLRRLEIGPFSLSDAVKLEELSQEHIQKPDRVLCFLPEIRLSRDEARKISSGSFLHYKYNLSSGFYRLYTQEIFIGIGYLENGQLRPHRLLSDVKSR